MFLCLINRFTSALAATTLKSSPSERNFFAIYVTYYVKVRLVVSGVGGDVSVKVPFVLMRDRPELVQDTPLPRLNVASSDGGQGKQELSGQPGGENNEIDASCHEKRQTGTGEPAARERTNSGHENDPKSNVAIDQMSAETEATEMSDMSVTTSQGSKVENIFTCEKSKNTASSST